VDDAHVIGEVITLPTSVWPGRANNRRGLRGGRDAWAPAVDNSLVFFAARAGACGVVACVVHGSISRALDLADPDVAEASARAVTSGVS